MKLLSYCDFVDRCELPVQKPRRTRRKAVQCLNGCCGGKLQNRGRRILCEYGKGKLWRVRVSCPTCGSSGILVTNRYGDFVKLFGRAVRV